MAHGRLQASRGSALTRSTANCACRRSLERTLPRLGRPVPQETVLTCAAGQKCFSVTKLAADAGPQLSASSPANAALNGVRRDANVRDCAHVSWGTSPRPIAPRSGSVGHGPFLRGTLRARTVINGRPIGRQRGPILGKQLHAVVDRAARSAITTMVVRIKLMTSTAMSPTE